MNFYLYIPIADTKVLNFASNSWLEYAYLPKYQPTPFSISSGLAENDLCVFPAAELPAQHRRPPM